MAWLGIASCTELGVPCVPDPLSMLRTMLLADQG